MFKSFSEVLDYEIIRVSGWRYSIINSIELLYQDDEIAMINSNFSRHREDASVQPANDSNHFLVPENASWEAKAAYSAREMIFRSDC